MEERSPYHLYQSKLVLLHQSYRPFQQNFSKQLPMNLFISIYGVMAPYFSLTASSESYRGHATRGPTVMGHILEVLKKDFFKSP